MNRFNSLTKPLMWFMALIMVAFVAGCGGGSSTPAAPSVSNSPKAINTFSLAWTTGGGNQATGTIDQTLKTIKLNVPYNTVLTTLVATFTTSPGVTVTVDSGTGPVAQASGVAQIPPIDYTLPVSYKVTAADGTWATYTVLVTVSANTAKAIQTFTLAASGVPSIGTVITENATPKTIAVTMPFGTTDLTALVATFTTTGSSVKISGVTQNTGALPTNDFTNSVTTPLVYTVTAANGTTATYNVSVTVALNSAKTISAFSLAGVSGVPASTATAITGSASPFDILVTMPNGTTDLTALVATYTATGASSVKVGGTVQTSGTSQNDFSAALAASGVTPTPVAYLVTAADGSTATYNVTVNVAAVTGPVVCTGAPNCVDLGTSANYAIFGKAGVTNVSTTATIGNVGSAAAASTITGFALVADSTNVFSTSTQVTGKVYAVDYAPPTPSDVGTASNDMLTAYTAANAVGGGAGVGTACPGTGNFGGQAIPPGVYTCAGVTIPSNFTLAGTGAATDVWVFKLSGTLGMTGGAGMTFTGTQGALPQNVFWAVAGAVSIGVGSTLEGVILGATNIDTLAGSVVHGRLLAQTLVNLQGGTNTVTQP